MYAARTNVARYNRLALLASQKSTSFSTITSGLTKLVDGSTAADKCLTSTIDDDTTLWVSIQLEESYEIDDIVVKFERLGGGKNPKRSNSHHALFAGAFPGTGSSVYGPTDTCTKDFDICMIDDWTPVHSGTVFAEYVTISSFRTSDGGGKKRRRQLGKDDGGDYLCDEGKCHEESEKKWDANFGVCELEVYAKFCPAGYVYVRASNVCSEAPKGKYSVGGHISTGAKAAKDCPAGRYGNSLGLSTSSCSGACSAGYRCPAGSTSSKQMECVGVTHYCSGGVAKVVDTGHYSAPLSSSVTTRSQQNVAEQGYYAIGGVRYPCPAGRFGSLLGAVDELCSGPCSGGFYCPEGSQMATAVECAGPGIVCPPGSATPADASEGYYTYNANGEESLDRSVPRPSGEKICPAGSYCSNGVRRKCPPGTKNPSTGSSTVDDCDPCPAGSYCPLGSVTETECPPGFFCLVESGTPSPCPPGTYRESTSGESLDSCDKCAANRYSTVANATSDEHCRSCTPLETSPPGSPACFPGLQTVEAIDTGKLEAGISLLDEIHFTFTSPTSRPEVTSKQAVDSILVFSSAIGEDYTGRWNPTGDVLTIILQDVTGVNVLQTAIGTLTVSVLPGTIGAPPEAKLNNSLSPASPELLVTGSWGESSQPQLVSATAIPLGSSDGDRPRRPWPQQGDGILLEFDQLVRQISLDDVSSFIYFSAPVATQFSAQWVSGTDVLVTVESPALDEEADDFAVDLETLAALSPGNLNVSVFAAAGLTSLDGASPASESTDIPVYGTWGLGLSTPPVVESHSPTSMVLRWSAPSSLQYSLEQHSARGFAVGSSLTLALSHYHVRMCQLPNATESAAAPLSTCVSALAASSRSMLPLLPVGAIGDLSSITVEVKPVLSITSTSLAPLITDAFLTTRTGAVRYVEMESTPAVFLNREWTQVGPEPALLVGPFQGCECRVLPLATDARTYMNDTATTVGASCDPRYFTSTDSKTCCRCTSSDSLEVPRLAKGSEAPEAYLWGTPCAPDIMTPLSPLLESVQNAQGLSTAGGERFVVFGDGLGTIVPELSSTLGLTSDAEPTMRGLLATALGTYATLSSTTPAPTVAARSTSSVPYLRVVFGDRFVAVDCDILESQTQIRCLTIPAAGRDLELNVALNGVSAVLSEEAVDWPMLSFAPPVVTSFSGDGAQGASTTGGDTIVINGRAFGTKALNALRRVTYNATSNGISTMFEAQNCSITQDHVQITCQVAPGAGTKLAWRVNIAGQDSLFPNTNYAPPVVTEVVPFDPASSPLPSASCPLLVTASGRVYGGETPVPSWDGYEVPENRFAFGTRGQQIFDVVGVDFGPTLDLIDRVHLVHVLSGTAVAVFDGSDSNTTVADGCTLVVPHTRLRCRMPPGAGTGFAVVVTVLSQASSAVDAPTISFSAPTITSSSPVAVPTEGLDNGAVLTLTGRNFPPSGWAIPKSSLQVTYAGMPVTFSVVKEFSSVSIVPPAVPYIVGDPSFVGTCAGSASESMRARVTVAVGEDVFSMWQCLAAPVVRRMAVDSTRRNTSASITAVASGLPNPGLYLLEVYGSSFGAQRTWTLQDSASSTPCRQLTPKELTYHLTDFDPAVDTPHTTIFCWIDSRRAVLTLGNGASIAATLSYDYDVLKTAPSVTGASVVGTTASWPTPDSVPSHTAIDDPILSTTLGVGAQALDPRGGSVVEVRGTNLISATSVQLVKLDPLDTAPVIQRARTSVLDCPLLYRSDTLLTVSDTGELATAPDGPCPVALGYDETATTYESSETVCMGAAVLRCSVPPGSGTNWYVLVKAGLSEGISPSPVVRFRSPVATTISPTIVPTVGDVLVSIKGRNFGSSISTHSSDSKQVTIGGRPCLPIQSWRDHEINCTAPIGASPRAEIRVTVGGQSGPVHPQSAGLSPQIVAFDGDDDAGDDSELAASSYSTVLQYMSPRLEGLESEFEGQAVTLTSSSGVDLATLSSPSNGSVIVLRGSNFGPSPFLTVAPPQWLTERVGERPAQPCVTIAQNHTTVVCRLPASSGRNYTLQIETGFRAPLPVARLNIALPSISRVVFDSAATYNRISSESGEGLRPTRGGFLVHLFGTSFSSDPRVSVGGRVCETVWAMWSSSAPGGVGRVVGTVAQARAAGVTLLPLGSPLIAANADVRASSHEQISCLVPSGTGVASTVSVYLDTAASVMGNEAPDPAGTDTAGAWTLAAVDDGVARAFVGVIGYDPPVLDVVSPLYLDVVDRRDLTLSMTNLGATATAGTNVSALSRSLPDRLPVVVSTPDGARKVTVPAARPNPVVVSDICGSLQVTQPYEELQCRSSGGDAVRVGLVHLSVFVDSQSSIHRAVFALCPPGYYGQFGETCKLCPAGATCAGGFLDPLPLQGNYKLTRELFTPCEPRVACPGYSSEEVLQAMPFSSLSIGRRLPPPLPELSDSDTAMVTSANNSTQLLESMLDLLNDGAARKASALSDREIASMLPPESTVDVYTFMGSSSSVSQVWRSAHVVNGMSTSSQCSSAYTGLRCAECAPNHYRLNTRCEPCPELAELYIAAFFLVILMLVGLGYWFNKKRVNLAAASLGWDFAQIVAVVGTMFVYPEALQVIFTAVSASNFNLQILAPECSLQVTFRDKFYIVASLPPFIIAIALLALAVLYITSIVRNMSKAPASSRRRSSTATKADISSTPKPNFLNRNPMLLSESTEASDIDAAVAESSEATKREAAKARLRPKSSIAEPIDVLVGLAITLMYFGYINVTRNSMLIFDCITAVRPSDGATVRVLEAEPAVLCDTSDPVYAELLPWAWVTGVVYGLGIPGFFGAILYVYRNEIRADQVLRGRGEGASAESNQNFAVRRRFDRLYADFKDKFFYWRLVLLARKMCIVIVSTMASSYPLFQASTAILVLFLSFWMQIKYEPFLEAAPLSKNFLALSDSKTDKKAEDEENRESATSSKSSSSKKKPASQNSASWNSFVTVLRTISPAAVLLLRDVRGKSSEHSTGPSIASSIATSKRNLAQDAEASIARRDANDEELVALSRLARESSAGYVFDYNALERSFLVTSIVLLSGGMIFASSALSPGSFFYVLLSFILGFLLITSILTFIFLLGAELFRSLRFASVYERAREYEDRIRREIVQVVRALDTIDATFASDNLDHKASNPAAGIFASRHPPPDDDDDDDNNNPGAGTGALSSPAEQKSAPSPLLPARSFAGTMAAARFARTLAKRAQDKRGATPNPLHSISRSKSAHNVSPDSPVKKPGLQVATRTFSRRARRKKQQDP